MKKAGKAVPSLIKVMKSDEYPIKNRWLATFMLGRIMGKKASAFLSKFTAHPHWMMRLAALKTLLALGEDRLTNFYPQLLKDDSLLVKSQALENISHLKLYKFTPQIARMLVDKANYHKTKKGLQRSHLIGKVIKTLGDLKYEKGRKSFNKMMLDPEYNDIHAELHYALSKFSAKDNIKELKVSQNN
ncbi:MAG: HEAT repeat domain-containing protein [Bacteriovoracia bacterium]